jgi:hypothetical protein
LPESARGGSGIRDVQETVLVLVLLIYRAHESGSRWQDLIDEDEDGLLRRQLDALADHVNELADCQVCGDQVFLLVDGRDVRLLDLLANNLGAVSSTSSVRDVGKRTGMRSLYFWRMRSASALRFSNGCSSLNLERIVVLDKAGF